MPSVATIRKSPSGPRMEVLVLPEGTRDPNLFLNQEGDWVAVAASGVVYTVGPENSGAEYQTIQAAVNAAAAAGVGTSYGNAATFYLAPFSYSENVVIPDTMPHFHIRAVGGNSGTFTTSITVNVPATVDTDISIDHMAMTNLTFNQPGAGGSGTWYVNVTNTWVFGDVNVVMPNGRFYFANSHWYGNGSQLIFDGLELTLYDCEFVGATDALRVIDATASSEITISNSRIRGNVRAAGPTFRMFGCDQTNGSGDPAVTDECTGTSFYFGNSLDSSDGTTRGGYVKTGTSVLRESGNNFSNRIAFPFISGTGTILPSYKTGLNGPFVEIFGGAAEALLPEQLRGVHTHVIKQDGGGSVALPSGAFFQQNQQVTFSDLGNATGAPWTIETSGGETIDGAANYAMSTDWQSVTLARLPNNNWKIVSTN